MAETLGCLVKVGTTYWHIGVEILDHRDKAEVLNCPGTPIMAEVEFKGTLERLDRF